MKLVPGDKQIYSEVCYSTDYRYRLWLAAVGEIAPLGLGYRAYCDQIGRQFSSWKNNGYVFSDPRGHLLNPDTLLHDDMYGFLGKDWDQLKGPGRRINDEKIAIIDCYFKAKTPGLALSFDRGQLALSLAILHRSFLGLSEIDREKSSLNTRCEEAGGVYISKVYTRIPESKRPRDVKGHPPPCLPIFYIVGLPNQFHCIVHRVEWPISEDMYLEGSKEHAYVCARRDGLRAIPVPVYRIYSGIGIPVRFPDGASGDLALSIFLRERVQAFPCSSILTFSMDLGVEEDKFSGIALERASSPHILDMFGWVGRIPKEKNYRFNNHEVFSNIFIERVFALCSELGTEV